MSESLDAFRALVESHVKAIVDAAHAAPPGGGHAWDTMLAHYGLTGDSAASRVDEMARHGCTRGAVPSEVGRVLHAMTSSAAADLARRGGDASIAAWLGEIPSRELARYAPIKEVAKKVASVFANAAATSKQVPWANAKSVSSVILACPACGAPQERALDFQCRYCRSSLGS